MCVLAKLHPEATQKSFIALNSVKFHNASRFLDIFRDSATIGNYERRSACPRCKHGEGKCVIAGGQHIDVSVDARFELVGRAALSFLKL
jgi:hypothetical protein